MSSLKELQKLEKDIDLEKCFRLQRKLSALSYSEERKRFNDLYNLTYWQPIVRTAIRIVRTRSGAKTSGIDGMNKNNINDLKLQNEICKELKARILMPSKLRKVEIPKPNSDKVRTLLIPTYKDRVVLTILKLILEPIFEPHFDHSSQGFRPNRNAHDAIAEIRYYIGDKMKYSWVIETDIANCFPSIKRSRAMSVISERIADDKLLQLINKYLSAKMAMEGFYSDLKEHENLGCPQGSSLSPLICNIFLTKLDEYVNKYYHRILEEKEKGNNKLSNTAKNRSVRRSYLRQKDRQKRIGGYHLIRYADDLVIMSCSSRSNVERYLESIKEFAWKELGLKLAPEKTRITHVKNGFNFLGFNIKRIYRKDLNKRIALVTIDPTRKKRHRETIKTLLKGGYQREVGNVIKAINLRVRGWRNYFQKSVTNCEILDYIDQSIFWRLTKWLKKKYKAPISKVYKTFYRRVHTPDGKHFKTLTIDKIYVEKASWALPKHRFDFTRKHKHPWSGYKKPQNMINEAFPNNPRPPTWNGNSTYGENYAKMARKALERDHYRCNKCGSEENLHVHHLNKRSSYANPKDKQVNCLSNLATLCAKCHKFANRINAIDCINWLLARD